MGADAVLLLDALIDASEAAGLWTLQAGVLADNAASLALHERAGFRRVGVQKGLGQDRTGRWRDVVLLERAQDVGGTWRDNTYPGAACDVQSNLYSFSFALNPDWGRSYSEQPEIQAYLQRVARASGVLDRFVFDTRVDPYELRLRAAAVIISLATGPYRSQDADWQPETRRMVAAAEALVRSAVGPR